ncbi:hypothetical protein BaRGS_00022167 [Batillaria attramentaria]|uniref:Uncharacterized protein n=1 Tax=Batillaria attramentaria TaxID=370345 RepID=A0ABD0KHZ0_9CAEN
MNRPMRTPNVKHYCSGTFHMCNSYCEGGVLSSNQQQAVCTGGFVFLTQQPAPIDLSPPTSSLHSKLSGISVAQCPSGCMAAMS